MSFGGKYRGRFWKMKDGEIAYDIEFTGYADKVEVEMELAKSLPEASSRAAQRYIDAVDEYIKKVWLDD